MRCPGQKFGPRHGKIGRNFQERDQYLTPSAFDKKKLEKKSRLPARIFLEQDSIDIEVDEFSQQSSLYGHPRIMGSDRRRKQYEMTR